MDGEGFIGDCRLIWLGLYLIVLLPCCRESSFFQYSHPSSLFPPLGAGSTQRLFVLARDREEEGRDRSCGVHLRTNVG